MLSLMDSKQMNKVLALLFVGVLMGALDLAIVGPALPAMQADFGMNNRQLSWLFNIYVLFQLVSAPLLAKMSDRYGRRSVYIFSVSGFALGSLLLVLSPSVDFLMAGRAIQGFGAGGIFPVAAAIIGDTFPVEKRGGALGLMGAVFGLAFLIGPILGGILLQWSWHWLFLINLPIAVALVFFAWRLLPAAGASEPKAFDWRGALSLSVALGSLAVAVTNFDSANPGASFRSLSVWPWLVLMAVLLPVFWRVEHSAEDPIVKPSFFSVGQIRLTMIIAAGIGTVESGSVFFPAFAVAALGVTESMAAWLLVPSVVAMTIAAPLVGRILHITGSRLIVQTGLACVLAGILMYALLDLNTTLFIVGGIIGGIGLAGLLGAPLRYIVLNEAAREDRAAAQGLLTVFLAVGQLMGAAIVGGVAASRGGGEVGYQASFTVLAVLTSVILLVAFLLNSRAQEQKQAELAAQAPAE
jgi:EmrB/QacA subfamily drug resistance transporter